MDAILILSGPLADTIVVQRALRPSPSPASLLAKVHTALTTQKAQPQSHAHPLVYSPPHSDHAVVCISHHKLVYAALCLPTRDAIVTAAQFLQDLLAALAQYFAPPLTPAVVQANTVHVGMVIDELLAYPAGQPVHVFHNQLTALLPLPDLLSRVTSTGMGHLLASGPTSARTSAAAPWRRSLVKYTANEVYVDLVEHVVGSVTLLPSTSRYAQQQQQRVQRSNTHVHGEINVHAKLSGTPDLSLSLTCPALSPALVTCAHPAAVAGAAQSKSRNLTPPTPGARLPGDLVCVPPDGRFTLAQYTCADVDAAGWVRVQAVRDVHLQRIQVVVSLPGDNVFDWSHAESVTVGVHVPARFSVGSLRTSTGSTRQRSPRVLEWSPKVNPVGSAPAASSAKGTAAAMGSAGAAAAAAALSKLAASAPAAAAPGLARGLGAAASGLASASDAVGANGAAGGGAAGGGAGMSLTVTLVPRVQDDEAGQEGAAGDDAGGESDGVGGGGDPMRMPFMTSVGLSGRLVTKASVSGVKVSRVGVHKEEYKAYQGVKYVVVADGVEYRVSC